MHRFLLAFALIALMFPHAQTAPVERTVSYHADETEMEGFLAYDDAAEGKRPAILIIHAWRGIQEHERDVARRLAGLGYVAFCADIYGRGIRPQGPEQAAPIASRYRGDLDLYRERLKHGLNTLREMDNVDADRIVAIGYCFGGTGALEIARAGMPVRGVVSFHGGLKTDEDKRADKLDTKLLILHGAVDPYVPEEEVDAFLKEMEEADADYQMIFYGGQVHAFTDETAQAEGARYDEKTDRRSWQHFMLFLEEVMK